jgi:release factor glutamine methyltransferase
VRFFSGGRLSRPTVGEALQTGVVSLQHVTDAPQLESEVLLGHVMGVPRTALVAHPERTVKPNHEGQYTELVAQRAAHYPLPYITGQAEFYGLPLEVTPEVLIPRPETELLVDLALARNPASLIDVGTGSGCIAIALARQLPDALVYAIEASPTALAVARRNAERHGVANRVQLMAGDLLTPRPPLVDLIVSNPPYVSSDEWASLPASVRDFEPRLALDGGRDGLAVIQRLLAEAPAVVRPGGALLVEVGASQGRAVAELAGTAFPGARIEVHADLAGHDRVVEVQT